MMNATKNFLKEEVSGSTSQSHKGIILITWTERTGVSFLGHTPKIIQNWWSHLSSLVLIGEGIKEYLLRSVGKNNLRDFTLDLLLSKWLYGSLYKQPFISTNMNDQLYFFHQYGIRIPNIIYRDQICVLSNPYLPLYDFRTIIQLS